MEKKNEKKRPEHLSTTIGDLLKVQGNDILKTEKKPYKKNNKNRKNKNFNKKPQEKKEQATAEVPVMKVDVLGPNKRTYSSETLKKAIDEAVEKGILRADDNVKFDMRTPEEIEKDKYKNGVIITEGSMEELASAFFAAPEPEGPKMNNDHETKNKFIINSEYITKEGTDVRVRTDEFIKK